MPIRGTALLALGLSVAVPASGQRAPRATPQPAGWYELAPEHEVLVTWAPGGDAAYRILDFDSLRFEPLEPDEDRGFTWRRGDEESDRRVEFLVDEGGTTGFRWTADGRTGTATKLDPGPFEQVNVRFDSDGVELAGTIMLPASDTERPVPGAVFIHGSGTSDRDNVWAYTFAQHLARRGVAVLLPDKRGSGSSGGDWTTADFEVLAEDALAGVETLAARPEVDPGRVGLVGLSQGGWIAPLAASTSDDVAFVVAISGAATTPAEQVRHEVEQSLRGAGLEDEAVARVLELQDRAAAFVRTADDDTWRAYDALRRSLLETPLAEAVEPYPEARDDPAWAWWRAVGDYDPLPDWRGLEIPVLAIFGAEDERENVPVERSVSRLEGALEIDRREDRAIVVYPESGHALADPETGWVRTDALERIATWILEHAGR